MIFFNEKKIEKDSDNFWRKKLTLKVRGWSDKKFVLWKSAIFHSIKLPFDVQAAEKILHVIYW